ncbi:MAG: hypothetical protein L6Q95_05240 [Planctomycetes bacterium]|nr:hypothetical protein [Planctomycetota bacterium]
MRTLATILLVPALAAADTVVLRDRTILEGPVTRSDASLAVAGRSVPLDEVLLWEDEKGLALHAPSFEAQLDACRALAVRERLAQCRKLFPEAVAAGAVDAAREMLVLAALSGLPAKEAADWDKRLLSAERKEGAAGAAPDAGTVLSDLLCKRAKAELGAGEGHELRGRQLLRAALRMNEANEAALALLEEIAPESPPFARPLEGRPDPVKARRIWLDWEVDVLRGEVRPLGRRAPDMERARNVWRKDLNGVETREEGAEIVFLTPIDDRTEILGKCVRYAKITSRALARIFATDNPRRDDNEPLVIYFFESRDAYVESLGGNPMARMSLGVYSRSDNVSRFFWPETPDATREVRRVFVHELTHHWIERRNPRWHASDFSTDENRGIVPGYWVVEGFATFIEEGSYDIETYKWSNFAPHAGSLSVVAALSKEKERTLIDWEKLFGLSQAEAQGEWVKKPGVVATAKKTWGITPQPFAVGRLFYEQSAAACHYLYWAEDGKYRGNLIDFMTAHYTAKREGTDIKTAFGLTPKDLGARIEEFARKVTDGAWRPTKP